jgi:hypothetical protein
MGEECDAILNTQQAELVRMEDAAGVAPLRILQTLGRVDGL